ncbi:PREDICTED: uncharacterized protein LOC109585223 [Amphimedon queenslandica]|uniref:VWFA domain-containing protein n=1 Tax=Amphimedon queenslandica TaxID=400682 RepID=A0A1X7U073_AMPQE|nr:PREDICTED: uncharacterized protein LOC109585223 [Amphimedon queenslandica]|eukprot:XP_019856776.1 PREDICTED: uncharacterized protein LOC109585223 [Amphimedon queenslandica]
MFWSGLLILFVLHFTNGCREVVSDLVILIDESTSISPKDFEVEKQFAANITNQFFDSKGMTHAAVIRFSDTERTLVISHLGDVNNPVILKEIILAISNNDSDFGRGASTHHKDAMILAREQLRDRGRNGVRKIIIFITDGLPEDENSRIKGSNSPQSAIGEATFARSEGVEIFCIGAFYPNTIVNATLELIAIAGDPNRVIVTNFESLNNSLADRVTEKICDYMQSSSDTLPMQSSIGNEGQITQVSSVPKSQTLGTSIAQLLTITSCTSSSLVPSTSILSSLINDPSVTSSIQDNEGAGTVGPVNGMIIAALVISGLSPLLIIILIVVLFAVLLYLKKLKKTVSKSSNSSVGNETSNMAFDTNVSYETHKIQNEIATSFVYEEINNYQMSRKQ